jgi:putative FmdB family regulatory protein
MPIYEYKCGKCGVFEVMQRITEPSLRKCPTCRGKVERQMSLGSFVLKGSGWYATDYAKKGTANGTDATASSSTATDSSATASTSDTAKKPSVESKESKPATETKASSSDKTAAAKPAD